MQPEKVGEGKLSDTNEENDCGEKDEDVSEEGTLAKKNLHIKETIRGIS